MRPRTSTLFICNSFTRYSQYLAAGTELNEITRASKGLAASNSSSDNTHAAVAFQRARSHSLFTGNSVVSASDSPKLTHQNSDSDASAHYVNVPAAVLLAYCITRSWNFGREWIGTNFMTSKAGIAISLASILSYLIPGVMRVVEVRRNTQHTLVVFDAGNAFCSIPPATCWQLVTQKASAANLFATAARLCTLAIIGSTSFLMCAGFFATLFGFVLCWYS
jgi:hypothetical protein